MKTRKIPKIRKIFRLDIWTLRAMQMAMLQEGIDTETQLILQIIKQVLKHKRCPYAKNYTVEKKRNKIEVFCGELGNWVDVRQVCLGNCLMTEFKTGKRERGGILV